MLFALTTFSFPTFESIISGHPSDELQSALFESYSHRLLETRGDDPLYVTSEVPAIRCRHGSGKRAVFYRDLHLRLVNVRGWRDNFLSTSAATPLTRICL